MLIIMHGVSGSGKSWLSEQLINRYQIIRIRSDVERKRLHNLSPQQKSHANIGRDLYSQSSSDKTYQYLLQLAVEILNASYNVIVDATFVQQQQRQLFSKQAEQMQIPFLIIHTRIDKQTLLKRIKDRADKQDNVSEAGLAVLENQLQNLQALSTTELKGSMAIDTEKNTEFSRLWKFMDNIQES